MSPKSEKHVLKPGTSSVFVGCGAGGAAAAWRLDVRDDGKKRRSLFSHAPKARFGRGRPKLFHYISAGGMRQLRRTSADDLAESRRRSFLVFLGLMGVAWLVFYFLPCG
jgi:hypothetical protein